MAKIRQVPEFTTGEFKLAEYLGYAKEFSDAYAKEIDGLEEGQELLLDSEQLLEMVLIVRNLSQVVCILRDTVNETRSQIAEMNAMIESQVEPASATRH